MYYILDEYKRPVRIDNLIEWGKWFNKIKNRIVAKDHIEGIEISTVFLGVDHNYSGGAPVLFETMIFGGELDQECWRYNTWKEAIEGHKNAAELVKAELTLYQPSPQDSPRTGPDKKDCSGTD